MITKQRRFRIGGYFLLIFGIIWVFVSALYVYYWQNVKGYDEFWNAVILAVLLAVVFVLAFRFIRKSGKNRPKLSLKSSVLAGKKYT